MGMREIALSVDAMLLSVDTMPLHSQETCVYTVALQGKGSKIQGLLQRED
jgi:hypothetical protein